MIYIALTKTSSSQIFLNYSLFIALGNYPSLSLADARIKATSHRDLLNKGIDPRKGDVNEQSKLTFREQKNTHRWKPVTSNRHYKNLTRDIYPFIGDKSIDEITKAELLKIIQPHELLGHHEVTHRLHDRLETIFEFAVGYKN